MTRKVEVGRPQRYPSRMDSSYELRWATRADYGDLADVMFEAVRSGPSKYTERQREKWVPHRRSGEQWDARLDRQMIVVARTGTGIVGFMSLEPNGYIDFAYISHQRREPACSVSYTHGLNDTASSEVTKDCGYTPA